MNGGYLWKFWEVSATPCSKDRSSSRVFLSVQFLGNPGSCGSFLIRWQKTLAMHLSISQLAAEWEHLHVRSCMEISSGVVRSLLLPNVVLSRDVISGDCSWLSDFLFIYIVLMSVLEGSNCCWDFKYAKEITHQDLRKEENGWSDAGSSFRQICGGHVYENIHSVKHFLRRYFVSIFYFGSGHWKMSNFS